MEDILGRDTIQAQNHRRLLAVHHALRHRSVHLLRLGDKLPLQCVLGWLLERRWTVRVDCIVEVTGQPLEPRCVQGCLSRAGVRGLCHGIHSSPFLRV